MASHSMQNSFVDALMKTRPKNHPSGQGKGHLSAKGVVKRPKNKKVAPTIKRSGQSMRMLGTR